MRQESHANRLSPVYATMNEAYLALQESWPVVTDRNHNSMTLADQQGCRLILQECKA